MILVASGLGRPAKNMNRRGRASSGSERSVPSGLSMKTRRNLYPLIYAFNNLYLAYVKARRGKRYKPEVLQFSAGLERELISLYRELANHSYCTGEYRRFTVYEPKRREVAALPFRDRVVHHALCNVIEPIFERGFIGDSYACRVGKGTHAAADRLTEFLRGAYRRWSGCYVLKADVASYFSSVDHGVLMDIIRRKIACPETLELTGGILSSWNGDTGRGIPIGNLTSQLFANVYLNELDQFIKHGLRARYYVRYMDDLILLAADKAVLWGWQSRIEQFLGDALRLHLNHKTDIFPEARGVDFVGYRTWRTHRLLRKRSVRQMRRTLKALKVKYAAGEVDIETISAVVASWVGHASHADTYRLRCKVFGEFRI